MLEWGVGVIKESQLKLFKRLWVKAEIIRKGEKEILIVHFCLKAEFIGQDGAILPDDQPIKFRGNRTG